MKIKPLAFYLPQYHPIPENDEWWGKGFTEWKNVTKAKPLYRGHKQPRFPADLGYYDLRLPEVREAQVQMAKNYGIYGFVYYHYWFGNGKQLIERPLNEVIESGRPDFPFCLCWANQTWSGIWHGAPKKILIEQTYPGEDDIKLHFEYLLKAFKDPRYIKIDGKPLFMIYDIDNLEKPKEFINFMNELAIKNELKGIYFMASNLPNSKTAINDVGFNGAVSNTFNSVFGELINFKNNNIFKKGYSKIRERVFDFYKVKRINHRLLSSKIKFENRGVETFPIVVPNWDNTPRSSSRGVVLENSSPELFGEDVRKAVNYLEKQNLTESFLFIKSWNEWAEGNYLEPDTITGYKYLEALKKNIY